MLGHGRDGTASGEMKYSVRILKKRREGFGVKQARTLDVCAEQPQFFHSRAGADDASNAASTFNQRAHEMWSDKPGGSRNDVHQTPHTAQTMCATRFFRGSGTNRSA